MADVPKKLVKKYNSEVCIFCIQFTNFWAMFQNPVLSISHLFIILLRSMISHNLHGLYTRDEQILDAMSPW